MKTRGIRNNNPLNIRRSISQWIGLSKFQNDKSFCQFESMVFGVRAGLYLIHRYIYDYHLFTPRKIILRWAPPSENDVDSYIKHFNRLSRDNFDVDCALNGHIDRFYELVRVMCLIESRFRLDRSTFNKAFDLLPYKFKSNFL